MPSPPPPPRRLAVRQIGVDVAVDGGKDDEAALVAFSLARGRLAREQLRLARREPPRGHRAIARGRRVDRGAAPCLARRRAAGARSLGARPRTARAARRWRRRARAPTAARRDRWGPSSVGVALDPQLRRGRARASATPPDTDVSEARSVEKVMEKCRSQADRYLGRERREWRHTSEVPYRAPPPGVAPPRRPSGRAAAVRRCSARRRAGHGRRAGQPVRQRAACGRSRQDRAQRGQRGARRTALPSPPAAAGRRGATSETR